MPGIAGAASLISAAACVCRLDPARRDVALVRLFPAILRPARVADLSDATSLANNDDRRAHSRNRRARPRAVRAAGRSVRRADRQAHACAYRRSPDSALVFVASFFLAPPPAAAADRLLEFLHRRSARHLLQTLRARDDHSRPHHDDRLRAGRARNRSTARRRKPGSANFSRCRFSPAPV